MEKDAMQLLDTSFLSVVVQSTGGLTDMDVEGSQYNHGYMSKLETRVLSFSTYDMLQHNGKTTHTSYLPITLTVKIHYIEVKKLVNQ